MYYLRDIIKFSISGFWVNFLVVLLLGFQGFDSNELNWLIPLISVISYMYFCDAKTKSKVIVLTSKYTPTSMLHSITSFALYNLFLHLSLTNQKLDILLSI